MNSAAILLVLLSAVVHTTWSVIAKRAPKTAAFYCITIFLGLLMYAPVCVPHVAANRGLLAAWPWFGTSGLFLGVYYVLMYRTYRKADISLAYPLLRVSPIFSTAWAIAFLREEVTALALCGILATVLGCMMLPLRSLRLSRAGVSLRHYANPVYAMAFAAALVTSVYIVVDKHAMTAFNPAGGARTAIDYVWLEMAVCCIVLLVFAVRDALSSAGGREAEGGALRPLRTALGPILLIAPMLLGAYVLVVAALAIPGSRAAYVGAFRLVSVVLTVVAGVVILKERFGTVRIAAALVIFAGLVMIGIG